MKLSKDQADRFIQHLWHIAPNGIKCPVCGNVKWGINEQIFEIIEFTGSTMSLGAGTNIVPLVVITCDNCQHTLTFNALKLGLLDREGNPTSNDKDFKGNE